MDPLIARIIGYAALTVVAFPFCKYVLGPLCGYTRMTSIRDAAKAYENCYNKTVEERAKVAIELGKAGRPSKLVCEYLDSTLPFPQNFSIK
ncbi:MAG: hypothetical protein ABIB71_07145 [Candidatus Woesearchaeota archaeon]